MTHDKRDMTKYEEAYQTIVSVLSYHDKHG